MKKNTISSKSARPRNNPSDSTWFTKSFFHAGVAYLKGIGVDRSVAKAIYWFEKSSKSGRADASTNLGSIYITHFKDLPKAWAYFTLAGEQGGSITDSGNDAGTDVKVYAKRIFERLDLSEAAEAKRFFKEALFDYKNALN